jgi:hypothetical protein
MPLGVQPVHDEPPLLTADMKRADLIEVLAHLRYHRDREKNQLSLIQIDREVAVYLIGLLGAH